MRIAVLGTGPVRQAIAGKLAELGHDVTVGTRSVATAMARTEPDTFGNPPFPAWVEQHPEVGVATLADAAAAAELVVNATNGSGSIAALEAAGEEHLAGKVLIDIANPLDFSAGMPPSLLVSNTDSLAEQIQHRLPDTRVVKALNTINAYVMVDPKQLAGGDHTVFVSGNDPAAKTQATELLRSFGWSDVIDLGDITTARGTEMYLPLVGAHLGSHPESGVQHQGGAVARRRSRPSRPHHVGTPLHRRDDRGERAGGRSGVWRATGDDNRGVERGEQHGPCDPGWQQPGSSTLGVGAMTWGQARGLARLHPAKLAYGGAHGSEEEQRALEASLEAGVNLFDTAAMYSGGASERRLGQLAKRTDALVASKFPAGFRFRVEDFPNELEASLTRLQRSSIDLYQHHFPTRRVSIPRLMEQLADAVDAGTVNAVGVSNYSTDQLRQAYAALAERGIPLASNQVEYSLLHRRPETDGVLDVCRELGVTLIAYTPLAGGLLTGKYFTQNRPGGLRRIRPRYRRTALDAIQPVVRLLTEIGERYAKTPARSRCGG